MRITLDPLGDLDVTDGVTLGQVRAHLVALVGTDAARASLTIGGARLSDDQVCGAPPLEPGAHIHVGPGPADPVGVAARSPWHLAVVDGIDAGAVGAPGQDGRVHVGRGCEGPGRLALTDPAVAVEHAVVVERPGRRRSRWTVRAACGGTWLPARRVPRVRGRRRVHPGDRLRVGGSVLELRRATPPEPAPSDPAPAAGPTLMAAAPALAAVVLALVTRNPLYLVFGLTGAVAAVPVLLRRRRRRPVTDPCGDLGPDPARIAVALAAGESPETTVTALARAGLAVVGPGARPVARALVGSALLTGTTLTVLAPQGSQRHWAWLRWVESRLGPAPSARVARTAEQAEHHLVAGSGPTLLVVEHPGPWRTVVDRWWLRAGEEDAVIGLHPDAGTVPAWCRWVLTIERSGAVLTGPGGGRAVAAPTASADWAERIARTVAARDATAAPAGPGHGGADPLPAVVGLADLIPTDEESVRTRWSRTRDGLVVPIGVGPDGPFLLDLATDGPHALVAGTTGAGKSELLQALVLGCALARPPADLAMVLVDFKGGAGLGACQDLPHVVGQVTDLDPVEAGRALDGLRWELRRRERLLAEAGAGDLDELRARTGHAPPRLLVVVDEFRAVTEDLAQFVPGLVRLAAQGRSLGIHLVLATQRPAGAVDAQMRANLALRICLRVTEPAESADVVEGPQAAAIPADRPGRAVIRTAGGTPVVVQTAWAAPRPRTGAAVRWAPGWATYGTGPARRLTDHAEQAVATVRSAAAAVGAPPPARIWLPALPERVELPTVGDDRLRLGRTDPPGATTWGELEWSGTGLLLVAGRDGSGRTTALRAIVDQALAAGRQVHVVGTAASAARIVGPDRAHVGTVVGPEDPRLLGRLIHLLLTEPPSGRSVLVVDDVAAVLAALDRLPRGVGTALWERLLREARLHDVGLAVAGRPAETARLTSHATERLVLAVDDPQDDAALGVPRDLAPGRDLPGRAVHVHGGRAVRCQVGVPGPGTPRPGTVGVRLRALPDAVGPCPTSTSTGVRLGVGGDTAEDVLLPERTCVLVVGPPGSGRSTVASGLAAGLASRGLRTITWPAPGPLLDERTAPHGPSDARDTAELGRALDAAPAEPLVVVVDDVEQLASSAPDLDERLAAATRDPRSGVLVVATARTDTAAAAYRGTCAALRATGAVLVLSPAEAGSAEVAGADLTWAVDPVRPRLPGRGALVHRGQVTPVQVARG